MFLLKSLPTRRMVERYAGDGDASEDVLRALSMMRSASVLIRDIERHLCAHDLSQLRFLVLVVVDRENTADGLRHADVGARIDVSRPVLSRAIRSLVDKGLMTEMPDKTDARSLRLVLSEKGKVRLSDVLPHYFEIIQTHMRGNPSAKSSDIMETIHE